MRSVTCSPTTWQCNNGTIYGATWTKTVPSVTATRTARLRRRAIYPYAGDLFGDGIDSDCDGLDCEAEAIDASLRPFGPTNGAKAALCETEDTF